MSEKMCKFLGLGRCLHPYMLIPRGICVAGHPFSMGCKQEQLIDYEDGIMVNKEVAIKAANDVAEKANEMSIPKRWCAICKYLEEGMFGKGKYCVVRKSRGDENGQIQIINAPYMNVCYLFEAFENKERKRR